MTPMIRTIVPLAALACGLAMSAPADATLHQAWTYQNPAEACQLSIPTTDTEVRPKATGFRNESTTKSAFVICGLVAPAQESSPNSFPIQVLLYMHSMDGIARIVNCTAVTGLDGVTPLVYSSKAEVSNSGVNYLIWYPSDFGGTTTIPNGYAISVTCTLPPQTSIISVAAWNSIEIGN